MDLKASLLFIGLILNPNVLIAQTVTRPSVECLNSIDFVECINANDRFPSIQALPSLGPVSIEVVPYQADKKTRTSNHLGGRIKSPPSTFRRGIVKPNKQTIRVKKWHSDNFQPDLIDY